MYLDTLSVFVSTSCGEFRNLTLSPSLSLSLCGSHQARLGAKSSQSYFQHLLIRRRLRRSECVSVPHMHGSEQDSSSRSSPAPTVLSLFFMIYAYVQVFGLCEACANSCHRSRNHNTVNIGLKRHFRCDCGNQQCRGGRDTDYSSTCLLCPMHSKEPTNTQNSYSHNFRHKYCFENCLHGGEEGEGSFQCMACLLSYSLC